MQQDSRFLQEWLTMQFCVQRELLNLRQGGDHWLTVLFALLAMFVLNTQQHLWFVRQDTTVHKPLSQCKHALLVHSVLDTGFQQSRTAATASEVVTALQSPVLIFQVFATRCTIVFQTQTLPCHNSKQLVPRQTFWEISILSVTCALLAAIVLEAQSSLCLVLLENIIHMSANNMWPNVFLARKDNTVQEHHH